MVTSSTNLLFCAAILISICYQRKWEQRNQSCYRRGIHKNKTISKWPPTSTKESLLILWFFNQWLLPPWFSFWGFSALVILSSLLVRFRARGVTVLKDMRISLKLKWFTRTYTKTSHMTWTLNIKIWALCLYNLYK